MPSSVIIAFCVESTLIALTIVMWLQPAFLFRQRKGPGGGAAHGHSKQRLLLRWAAVFLLGLTFLWSVLFGIVLSIHEISFKI
jgi:hypothetical protein